MNQFEGTLIAGRYEIREHIATGGMASVFKTWDHRVERIVAIKVLRSLDKNDLRAVERFRREARAAVLRRNRRVRRGRGVLQNRALDVDRREQHSRAVAVQQILRGGPDLLLNRHPLCGQHRVDSALLAEGVAAKAPDAGHHVGEVEVVGLQERR